MKRAFPFHSNAVWPPLGFVAFFALAYGMLDGGLWLIERAAPSLKGEISRIPEIMNIRSGILATAAGCYALYRLGRFHPWWNLGYTAWLRCSPWSPDKPLPLGPVLPVWQDAVVVGAIAAFARWHAQVDPVLPAIVFGLVYLVGMTLLLAVMRTWIPVLGLGFLWPALMLPAMKGTPAVGIIAGLIAVVWYGHRQSLKAFPWRRNDLNGPDAIRYKSGKSVMNMEIRIDVSNAPAAATTNVGWPFQALSPKFECASILVSTGLVVSTLIGWWTYCAILGFQVPSSPSLILLFAGVAALLRLAIYCSGLGPSFNLWGRLASGRIIVPGFDQVFVTPLMVVALAIVGGMAIRHSGSWYPEASAGVVAVVCFALVSGGPRMRKWILTGQHRYRLPARLGANKQLLRPI